METKTKLLLGGFFLFLLLIIGGGFYLKSSSEERRNLGFNELKGIKSYLIGGNTTVGYEYIDNETLHFWNEIDDYYLNMTSGIQFSNHYDETWTHNIFCAGYKTAEWNYLCTDDLPIELTVYSDNLTYVQINGTRTIQIAGRNIGMGIDYYLESNDLELKITTGLRHLSGDPITTDLGFAWKVNQIKIDNNVENDRIFVNDTWYDLSDDLDLMFKNMTKQETRYNSTWNGDCPDYCLNLTTYNETCVNCYDIANYSVYNPIPFYKLQDSSFVKLRWNPNLDYFLQVKNTSQYNSPVTLAIVTNGLNIGQTKKTSFYWRDPPVEFTKEVEGYNGVDTNTYYTASMDAQNDTLYLILIFGSPYAGQQGPTTISGAGLNFTQIGTDETLQYGQRITLWRAMTSDNATSGILTISFPGTQYSAFWSVTSVTNLNTTGTNGAGAVVQLVQGETFSRTLSAFESSDNYAFGAFCDIYVESAIPEGAGFTVISNSYDGILTEYKQDSIVVNATQRTTDIRSSSFALELRADTGVADNSPLVTLSTPANATSSSTTDYNFTCNVTDDFNIANTTIYVWHDNGTLFNSTLNSSTGTSLNYSFEIPTLIIDTYYWNCLAVDNASQSSWATNNFTLTVSSGDCWTKSAGKLIIPPGCKYYTNTLEGIIPV